MREKYKKAKFSILKFKTSLDQKAMKR